jgi:MFS family permease
MQNVADLMLVNILSCIVGALSEVMVQMTVADVYFVHERGLMNTIYYWFMTVGTSLAPLAGGYITSSQGWRWVWWWMAILFGGGLLAFVFLYEETMFTGPVIDGVAVNTEAATRQHSSKERSKGPGPNDIDAAKLETAPYESVEIDQSIPTKRYWQKLALWTSSSLPFSQVMKHTYQPFLIMFSIPAVFYMALEYGIMTACTTVPVTTLSSVMTLPPYNFGSSQIGLMGLAPFTGGCLSAILCGPLSDKIIIYLAKRNRGIFEPEMRLWLCLVFVPCVPAGLFMFGIGLDGGAHWLLPAFGLGLTSFGVVPASSAALTYLTDAYTDVCGHPHPSVYCPSYLSYSTRISRNNANSPLVDNCRLNRRSDIYSKHHFYNLRLCATAVGRPRRSEVVLRHLWADHFTRYDGQPSLYLLWEELPGHVGGEVRPFCPAVEYLSCKDDAGCND